VPHGRGRGGERERGRRRRGRGRGRGRGAGGSVIRGGPIFRSVFMGFIVLLCRLLLCRVHIVASMTLGKALRPHPLLA
jgi:hypothetical protein